MRVTMTRLRSVRLDSQQLPLYTISDQCACFLNKCFGKELKDVTYYVLGQSETVLAS